MGFPWLIKSGQEDAMQTITLSEAALALFRLHIRERRTVVSMVEEGNREALPRAGPRTG